MTDTKQEVVAFEWSGEKVTISHDHKFYVALMDKSYDTAQQAKDAIDRKLTEVKRIKKPKLELKVVDSEGVEHILYGVHAGNGNILYKPEVKGYSIKTYVDVSWIREAIAEVEQLRQRAEDIESVLYKFQTEFSGYDFKRLPVDEQYAHVEKTYAALLKMAQATDLEKMLPVAVAERLANESRKRRW